MMSSSLFKNELILFLYFFLSVYKIYLTLHLSSLCRFHLVEYQDISQVSISACTNSSKTDLLPPNGNLSQICTPTHMLLSAEFGQLLSDFYLH